MLPGITQRRSATASHGINHAGHQDIWRFFRIVVSGAACALTLFSLPSIAQTPTIDKVGSVGKTIPVDAYPVGRTEENSDRMYVYQWPGIHFLVAYKGSAFYFTVGNGKQHLRITVDGASLDPFVSLEPATYRIVTPGKSAHSVRIDTLNENLDGPKSIGAFSVAIGGQGLPVTARKRQIELIGDSFTVGAGNTSAIRDCDGEKAWLTTDTTQSFGADLAQHYDAQYEINAISGHGAIRNYNGSAGDTVPVAYPFLLRDKQLKYDDPRWEPSVIIVSLGTNDFSTPPHAGERWKTREEVSVDYQQASLDFLKEIRQRNPKALIVLWSTDTVRGIVAAETQKLAEALQRDGDHRVDFVNVPGLSFNACLSHPTTADDHTIAEAISKDIDMHGDVWR